MTKAESASKPKSSSSKPAGRSYPLRSQTAKSALHLTPSKLSPLKSQERKSSASPTSLTPSSKKCYVCQGIEEMRAIKLNDAVQEFTSKLESYREISKSLGENSSELKHAISTIKHFILHLEPKNIRKLFYEN